MTICFVSPFPPRHDGISEFNQDLIAGLQKNFQFDYFGVAINSDKTSNPSYDKAIRYQINKNDIKYYIDISKDINKSHADLICLQLEFALYGGFDGSYIKELIRNLEKKLVIVVHSSPINSYSRKQLIRKKFFQSISPYVSGFVVINPLQERVFKKWGLTNKIITIPHGAPDEIANYNPSLSKKKLGFTDKTIVFNFGLLHKKKGLEYLLAGFKDFVLQNNSNQIKLILAGETLINEKNNNYLDSLYTYIKKNKLEDNVEIINKFLKKEDIYLYLSASDIVILPYTKRNLVSSGPLSFAIEAKKFIITTPFPYAKILLSKEEAYFVPYENSQAIYKGIDYFFKHKNDKVAQMLKKVTQKSDKIKWTEIAKQYHAFFEEIIRL